ncbi:MAG: MarR family winged helix-turn-helix transcriptional regulator [Parvibaculum sp.]
MPAPSKDQDLEAFRFFDVFSDVGRLLEQNYDLRSGLSRHQTSLIIALLNQDGQTQTELANALGIHKVSAGIYISELETIGLVERRPHPKDGRAKCIFLTQLLHDLRGGGQDLLKTLHAGVIKGMSTKDYQVFMAGLEMMRANLVVMKDDVAPTQSD